MLILCINIFPCIQFIYVYNYNYIIVNIILSVLSTINY